MSENQKFGHEHAKAWSRQGLDELRAAFYPDSNIAQPTEYGMFGTTTPGEVGDGRRKEWETLKNEAPASALDHSLDKAEQSHSAPEPPTPALELE